DGAAHPLLGRGRDNPDGPPRERVLLLARDPAAGPLGAVEGDRLEAASLRARRDRGPARDGGVRAGPAVAERALPAGDHEAPDRGAAARAPRRPARPARADAAAHAVHRLRRDAGLVLLL